ncbi:MAG: segregation/condensation protein A [Candidatus Coatesbacteria bacterium]|nr:MAG: segregation/condensation protein A [Candidatus Coatesbacteria bacterium]
MDWKVELPIYEGPLDLLLFLINKNEVDVYDIPVARITEEYLDYIRLFEELDIALAGEFFVMAATLMEIKSAVMLPRAEPEAADFEDPRAELVKQLLEYKRYREAAGELAELAEARSKRFPVGGDGDNLPRGETGGSVSVFALITAFKEVMERSVTPDLFVPSTEGPTVEEQVEVIRSKLAGVGGRVRFGDLFEPGPKIVIIVTFLALLEVLKKGEARAEQNNPFGEIWLVPTTAAPG